MGDQQSRGDAPDETANEDARLQLAVQTAVQLVDGCDHASITVVSGDDLVVRAASDATAERADALQQELGQGPSREAIRSRGTVVSQDLAHDERWPDWAARASSDLDVASAASLSLFVADDFDGSLNLYGLRGHGFVDGGLATAQTLVERLAVGLLAGRDSDELNAVGSRTVIGQAQGILMERHDLDAAAALARLRGAGEQSGLKLAQVAVELVRTRRLPSGTAD